MKMDKSNCKEESSAFLQDDDCPWLRSLKKQVQYFVRFIMTESRHAMMNIE